jgi:hypothetical protein
VARTGEAQSGFVGVYTDSSGTQSCASIAPFTGTTLFLVATPEGPTAGGITGAELRIEVTHPEGWLFNYIPPLGSTTLGDLVDTDPGSQLDGSGLNLAFASCRIPAGSGRIALGTISVFNAGGAPTSLLVKRHSDPSNPGFQCPAFTLCDEPHYSMLCMSAASVAACSLSVGKSISVQDGGDRPVFTSGLNALPDGVPVGPEVRPTAARQTIEQPTLVVTLEEPDVVSDGALGLLPTVSKTLQDTIWLADWDFETGPGACVSTGWMHYDNRVLNDGGLYWSTSPAFDALPGIDGRAAVLRGFRSCWADTGYGNDWDQSLRLNYSGTASLSFDFALDTDTNDFMTIEADSGCASQTTYRLTKVPTQLRTHLPSATSTWGGDYVAQHVSVNLPFSAIQTCVYIRFSSDFEGSDQDGHFYSGIRAGLVVDNIVVTGGIAYTENFESQTLNPNVVPVNSAPGIPYGEWARLYFYPSDNDLCQDDERCAWIFLDPTSVASFPDMAFGPHGWIVRKWRDQALVSPWIELPEGSGTGTTLSFREFPGNRFGQSKIMRSWSVRGNPRFGSCVSAWSNESSKTHGTWQDLSTFTWTTRTEDASPFVPAEWDSMQIRFRVADWQYLFGSTDPVGAPNPGPGPYIDRVRIGRQVLAGPVISEGEDSRSQAQDAFPLGFARWDRHGTSRFSAALDLTPYNPNFVRPGDSIFVTVADRRGVGGLSQVSFHGIIVAGPHKGKAPSPYSAAGDTLFFTITPDSCRNASGQVVRDKFLVSLDDTYFRGGDVLYYFWLAQDRAGAVTSDPPGITLPVGDLSWALQRTGGLLEVSFLPTIAWASSYRARMDSHGDIEPTPSEIMNSPQSSCILYVNKVNLRRRSTERTSFMWTIDRLGYKGYYDVYDIQGYGNTNNDLAEGRGYYEQAGGYALIVHDAGRMPTDAIPSGLDAVLSKMRSDIYYNNWLNSSSLYNDYGFATLWVIGENVATTTNPIPLLDLMGVSSPRNALIGVDPILYATRPMSFMQAVGQSSASFPNVRLVNECPERRGFDSATPHVEASGTHQFETPNTGGEVAVIMKAATVTVTEPIPTVSRINTILMNFAWADVTNAPSTTYLLGPKLDLARNILNAALPPACVRSPVPTDPGEPMPPAAPPRVTALHQNSPNPFNPTTDIRFDLSAEMEIRLEIYDLAGRRVRALVAGPRPAGPNVVRWDARDGRGDPVPSGLYVCELRAGEYRGARKLMVVK